MGKNYYNNNNRNYTNNYNNNNNRGYYKSYNNTKWKNYSNSSSSSSSSSSYSSNSRSSGSSSQRNSSSDYSIYCDGAANKSSNGYGYASVYDSNGKNLVEKYSSHLSDKYDVVTINSPKFGENTHVIRSKYYDVNSQQNNGAELDAARAAYDIAKVMKSEGIVPTSIHSDSKLITDYWSNGHANYSKLSTDKGDAIRELSRSKETSALPIVYVPTNDNIADLGFKDRKK